MTTRCMCTGCPACCVKREPTCDVVDGHYFATQVHVQHRQVAAQGSPLCVLCFHRVDMHVTARRWTAFKTRFDVREVEAEHARREAVRRGPAPDLFTKRRPA